jgi:Bacterial SH3 domain
MPTAELTEVRLDGYRSPRSRVDMAHSWAPPISPLEPATDGDPSLEEETFDAIPADEHLFQPAEPSDISQTLMGFGLQRQLIVGAAIVATLAVGVLAYLFWPAVGEKTKTETAEAAPAAQSEPDITGQAAPRIPEPVRSAPTAVAWPDLPPSGTIESSPQIAVTASAPATQNRDIVFLQRPGVNIRSTPATNGPVLGTAPKGTRFKVSNRDGDWVQVEGDRLKGWINSQFLGPNDPR